MSKKMEEMILVAERKHAFAVIEPFDGFLQDGLATERVLKEYAKYHTFKRRGDMEEDPSYKQLIPYVVLRQDGKVLTYRRLAGGGETRLHCQRSLGFGGHMNDVVREVDDGRAHGVSFKTKLQDNLWREVAKEELDIGLKFEDCTLTYVGLVNDDNDSTGVGKVHLGLVAFLDLPSGKTVTVKETDAHAIEFQTVEEIKSHADEYESWSRFIMEAL